MNMSYHKSLLSVPVGPIISLYECSILQRVMTFSLVHDLYFPYCMQRFPLFHGYMNFNFNQKNNFVPANWFHETYDIPFMTQFFLGHMFCTC